MFARVVTIFRDKYREIGHLEGECNREIDQIRAEVCREFPINVSKQGIDACFSAFLRVFCMAESVYCREFGRRCQESERRRPARVGRGQRSAGSQLPAGSSCPSRCAIPGLSPRPPRSPKARDRGHPRRDEIPLEAGATRHASYSVTWHRNLERNFGLDAGSKSGNPIWALESDANSSLAVFLRSGGRMRQGTAVKTLCNSLAKAVRPS